MTAKELKIKEAWGIYYHQLTQIDENGWCFQKPVLNLDEIKKNTELDIHAFGFRPSSLSGIENNNGWISINTIEDLPTTEGSYFVYSKVYWGIGYRIDIFTGRLSNAVDHETGKPIFSHYQPIIKPKLPIY